MKFEWSMKKPPAICASTVCASTALTDDLSLTGNDPDHSRGEHQFVTFGISSTGRLLAISHVERDGHIRIISARPATRTERKFYEET